jgi:hypothetical protein
MNVTFFRHHPVVTLIKGPTDMVGPAQALKSEMGP